MEFSFLSAGARTGIQTLKQFDSLFQRSSNRLATGLKVNSASDDPTAFFTAKALNTRAGDLNRVIDTVGNNLGAVRAADVGLRALSQLVQVAQSIVEKASNAPAPRPTATGSVVINGSSDLTALAGVSDGDQFSVQVGAAAAVTVTVNSGDTPDALLAELNAIDNVQATISSAGTLEISTTNGEDLTLTEVTNTPLAGLGVTAGAFDSTSAVSPERAAAAAEFDAILGQINQLAADASFLGVNLLGGDRPVISFNEDGTSSLTLSGVDASAAGLGIAGAANGFQSSADIAAARADLTGALGSLRSHSSRFSTELAVAETRRAFTSGLSNVLREGASKLTLGDPNEEAANLLSLETRKGLASASLAITQRSESDVLRLFF